MHKSNPCICELTFYYGCGLLGHGAKDCEEGPYEDVELRFGEEVRASPWKVVKTPHDLKGVASRNLTEAFDVEQKRREQENVERMISKLQAIALNLKGRTQVKHSEAEEGGSRRVEGNEQINEVVRMEVEEHVNGAETVVTNVETSISAKHGRGKKTEDDGELLMLGAETGAVKRNKDVGGEAGAGREQRRGDDELKRVCKTWKRQMLVCDGNNSVDSGRGRCISGKRKQGDWGSEGNCRGET